MSSKEEGCILRTSAETEAAEVLNNESEGGHEQHEGERHAPAAAAAPLSLSPPPPSNGEIMGVEATSHKRTATISREQGDEDGKYAFLDDDDDDDEEVEPASSSLHSGLVPPCNPPRTNVNRSCSVPIDHPAATMTMTTAAVVIKKPSETSINKNQSRNSSPLLASRLNNKRLYLHALYMDATNTTTATTTATEESGASKADNKDRVTDQPVGAGVKDHTATKPGTNSGGKRKIIQIIQEPSQPEKRITSGGDDRIFPPFKKACKFGTNGQYAGIYSGLAIEAPVNPIPVVGVIEKAATAAAAGTTSFTNNNRKRKKKKSMQRKLIQEQPKLEKEIMMRGQNDNKIRSSSKKKKACSKLDRENKGRCTVEEEKKDAGNYHEGGFYNEFAAPYPIDATIEAAATLAGIRNSSNSNNNNKCNNNGPCSGGGRISHVLLENNHHHHHYNLEEEMSKLKTTRAKKALVNWDRNYKDLAEYIKKHGDCNIAQKSKLGIFINKQREQKKFFDEGKQSNMSQFKIDALVAIGFTWSKPKGQKAWDYHYNELLDYKRLHGTCNIPTRYGPNPALGRWVSEQRYQHKEWKRGQKTLITDDRVRKLNDVGFRWEIISSSKGKNDTTSSHSEPITTIRKHRQQRHSNLVKICTGKEAKCDD